MFLKVEERMRADGEGSELEEVTVGDLPLIRGRKAMNDRGGRACQRFRDARHRNRRSIGNIDCAKGIRVRQERRLRPRATSEWMTSRVPGGYEINLKFQV